MTDIQKHIDTAFKMLSAIAVSGDNVERMALAKEQLREAYKLLEDSEVSEQNE